MNRQSGLRALGDTEYDVLIIGGGIFGACAAWDAVQRGLKVALVEKSDFCAGVSANSFKMVHGGIRYIQHLDIPRVRSSCHERSALLRIAPHLVQPLPTLIPTYTPLRSGKLFLGTGMYLYDLLTLGRNAGIADATRHIPWSSFLSREQVLERFPGVPAQGLTGGAVFCDAQMYNPTRLVWSFIESAKRAGADALNYCRALRLTMTERRVTGCVVRDELTGEEITVRARGVLNAAGPWAEEVVGNDVGRPGRRGVYSRDAYFVIKRRFHGPHALAITGESSDADSLLGRGARHMFIVPWRDCTLVGVWHRIYEQSADEVTVSADELSTWIGEINRIYPGLDLTLDDVLIWNAGLLPFGEEQVEGAALSFGKRSLIVDHEKQDGVANLVTLIGIRYTMGRGDAQRAVDLLARKLGNSARRPATDRIPLAGGDIDNFEALVAQAVTVAGSGVSERVVRALVHNHGSLFERVVQIGRSTGEGLKALSAQTTVTAAELRYVARSESVETLADAVMRRTDLGSGGNPGLEVLQRAAAIVGEELGWDSARIADEVEQLVASYPVFTGEAGSVEKVMAVS